MDFMIQSHVIPVRIFLPITSSINRARVWARAWVEFKERIKAGFGQGSGNGFGKVGTEFEQRLSQG